MDINEQILEELKAIRKLLTIFSQDKLVEFQERFFDHEIIEENLL